MRYCAARLLLIFAAILISITYGYSQQKLTITSTTGKLIRVTPRLANIDRNSMYGAALKKTRQGEGLLGVVDIERAEESIHKKLFPDNSNQSRINSANNNNALARISSSTSVNMDGQTFSNFAPSDNNLAVGPNHIIQIINHSSGSAFKIWNKSGTVVQASVVLSTLTGKSGSGDPVVLYDQLADRWILTEFGITGQARYINTLIIAVSATADPTGSWKTYSFNVGSFFVDYPKFAIWNNAYYATTNDFNTSGTSYLGSSFYAFDRNAMLAGAPTATMIRSRLSGSGERYYSMAPVCLEGNTISNQSGLFAFLQDNTWVGAPADSLFVFEFTPNFSSPASSVVSPFRAMVTQSFNTNTGNLSQQGTSGTIQSLSERLMNKVIYRNFGSSESIVCNTTDLANGRTGVHWWELRRPGSGNWNIFQEGLYQPSGDSHNRFMGSIAINANGDIGLLYNVTSSSLYPSARFTARNSCDPSGQMTLPETVVKDGTTYEASNSRYGDYNSLSVDPVNGSFWGTAQYNATGYGTYGNWVTRIVNFSVTACNAGNPGTITGTTPLCTGQTTTYTSNGDAGGTWSSTNTSVASVNATTGLVTAAGAGTTDIAYTVGGTSSFKTLTVNPNVSAGTVSGSSPICTGGNAGYISDGTSGGQWSSDNQTVATVDANTGIVTAISPGTANIIYSISNSCNSSTASQSVTVSDCSNVSLSCPGNQAASATTGCTVNVSVPNPTATNASTLTWNMSGVTTGSSPGTGINYVGTAAFNIGVTTISYTATGSDGSTANCSFTVTVTDNTSLTITCPPNISNQQNGVGKCSAVINTPNPNISGDCSVTSLTWVMTGATTGSSQATGINYAGTQTFNVGITTVTYTVTNAQNNTVSCSFTVTVRNKKCPNSPAEPDVTVASTNDKLLVKVFPNPTETFFSLHIQSASTENVEISIYSINGKLVQKMKGSATKTYIFGELYSAGAYIVKVKQGAEQSIVKIVK